MQFASHQLEASDSGHFNIHISVTDKVPKENSLSRAYWDTFEKKSKKKQASVKNELTTLVNL